MNKIVWSNQSYLDSKEIIKFIAKDSKYYALKLIEKIELEVEKLKDFPKFGKIVSEIENKYIREIILGNYRIIYKIKEESILILRIIHSSTNFKKL